MTEDEQSQVLRAVEHDIELVQVDSMKAAGHTLWIGGKPYLIVVERSSLWSRA